MPLTTVSSSKKRICLFDKFVSMVCFFGRGDDVMDDGKIGRAAKTAQNEGPREYCRKRGIEDRDDVQYQQHP